MDTAGKTPLLIGYVEGEMNEEFMQKEFVGLYDKERSALYPLSWKDIHAISTDGNSAEHAVEDIATARSIPLTALRQLIGKKIGLILLINSGGGKVAVQDDMEKILRTVHANGGASAAYATDFVGSAASMVFAAAQKRYALEDSTFLFHAAHLEDMPAFTELQLDEHLRADIRYFRRLDMERQKRMILQDASKKVRKRIEWTFNIAVNNPENRLMDAYFRGEDLDGFIIKVYKRRHDLWHSFVHSCGYRSRGDAALFREIFEPFYPFFLPQEPNR